MKLPDEPNALSISTYSTRYGLAIPQASLSREDWQNLMGILRESNERFQFYKADMLMHAAQNFVVDKRDDKVVRQRLLWQDVYTPEEVKAFTPMEQAEFRYFRRIHNTEIARLANLAVSTVNNYLKVVRIWTLERRADFDLSVINFTDFESVASQSIQDVPFEAQRKILLDIQHQRIKALTEQDATTLEASMPKTNVVRLQAQAAKKAAQNGHTADSSNLTFYPDQRFQRPFVQKADLSGILGEQVDKLPDEPDVIGYTVEIKVWAIKKETGAKA